MKNKKKILDFYGKNYKPNKNAVQNNRRLKAH